MRTGIPLALALAFASACSSTSSGGPGVTTDAGGQDPEAGLDAAPARGCPGETPTTYAWRPPAATKTSACSEADLASLATASKQDALSIPDQLAAALGPACADCAMGKVSDTEWRAIVAGHDGYIGNVGGCVVALGAGETCGKAVDELSTCLIVGCAGCSDRRAQDTCADALTTVDGLCAPALRTTRKVCRADALVAAFDATGACQSIVETVRLFCGPPAQDGG